MNASSSHLQGRAAALLMTGVMVVATAGFLMGLKGDRSYEDDALVALPHEPPGTTASVGTTTLPASDYSDMRRRDTGPSSQWHPALHPAPTDFDFRHCITCHDPHTAHIQPIQTAKERSLAIRATRRAFNGAPPTIPHAVEQTDDAACYACHGNGWQVGDRIANRMSHAFLANCLQCHAGPAPRALASFAQPANNTFVGVPAPQSGPRAFPGAPPAIPHSTWMREDCLSCHGGHVGWPGLEVTHRWRANCVQCHVATTEMSQHPAVAFAKRK